MNAAVRGAARDERGQSLVEFALMVPILLLLLVGLIDFARGLQSYQALGNAVREAAREASVHGSGSSSQWGPAADDANVTAAVRTRAVGLVASDVAATSTWPTGNNARGSEVVVGATYRFRPVATTLVAGVTLTFSTQTRARIQR